MKSLLQRPERLTRLLLGVVALLEIWLITAGPDVSSAKAKVARSLAAGEQPHWEALADIGIHYSGWCGLALVLVLGLTTRWWLRPAVVPLDDYDLTARPKPWWWRWAMVGLALLFSTWYGMASFGQKSLWWDEVWSLRQCTHGQWKTVTTDGVEALKFSPATWKKCAFYQAKPTNHPAASVLQKISLDLWRKVTGAEREDFSELAARVPSLIASGIAVLLVMRVVGIGRGVALLAVLLALHPWHLRYGVESRAYALIIPLCLSGILASHRVIITKGRRLGPWVWFAINQAAWIYAFIPAVLDVGLMFLLTGWLLWRGETEQRDKRTLLIRHVVAHTFAALLWMQAYLPNLVQIPYISEPGNIPQVVDLSLAQNTLSQALFGVEWNRRQVGIEGAHLTSMVQRAGSPTAALLILGLGAGIALIGLRAASRRTPAIAALLAVPLAAAVVHMGMSAALGLYFYPRFVISVLPVLVAGWALFPQVLADYTQNQRRIALVMAAAFIWFTTHQRLVLKHVPYTPYRDVAAFLHTLAEPGQPKPQVVEFGLGREAMEAYYPDAISTSELPDLLKARVDAKAAGRECYVVLGYPTFHTQRLPEAMAALRDVRQFREIKGWPGIEEDFYFRVYQALP